MANQPHNKTGKKCSRCRKVFTSSMATFTLPKREDGMIVHRLVCKDCHIKEYSKGE